MKGDDLSKVHYYSNQRFEAKQRGNPLKS